MSSTHRAQFAVLFCSVAASLTPIAAQAQRGGAAQPDGWAPVSVGIRAGYDNNSTGSVVGAQLRLPVLRSGRVELVPNGDITFLTGLKEYQYGVDLVLVSGGSRGGLYAGAGLGWRNTIYEGPDRESRSAPTVMLGIRSAPIFGAPFNTQFELRWIFPDEGAFKPQAFTIGVNLPLWGWS